MNRTTPDDTIAAISTPLGEGGIGIVRLSGPDAVAIAARVFRSSRGRDIQTAKGPVFHGQIVDADGPVDEVLAHVMRAPHTYTREDVVEINCHGGVAAVRAILDAVLAAGARLAEPGEFTKRAFLNGRIDLVQAEAVADVIQARTRAGLRAAHAASEGRLSRAIGAIKDRLVRVEALLESVIDFDDQDLPALDDEEVQGHIETARREIDNLLRTAEAGRLYREGAGVVIAGRPNVGKSSLFNALLRDARAIVTEVPGTTRDLIEETINIAGVPVRLMDTAGLRAAGDRVEAIGIEVARNALKNADLVVFVIEAGAVFDDDETLYRESEAAGLPLVLVVNKIDAFPNGVLPGWAQQVSERCRVSALTGEGLGELEAALAKMLLGGAVPAPESALVTRMHQHDSLRRAAAALDRLRADYCVSPEFLSIELRDALAALGEITGETTPDDVLAHIFNTFCIGK